MKHVRHQDHIALRSQPARHLAMRCADAPDVGQVKHARPMASAIRAKQNRFGCSVNRAYLDVSFDHTFLDLF